MEDKILFKGFTNNETFIERGERAYNKLKQQYNIMCDF